MKKYLSPPMLAASLSPQGKKLRKRLENMFPKRVKKRGYFIPAAVLLILAAGALVACVPKQPVIEAETVEKTQHGYVVTTPSGGEITVDAVELPEETSPGEPVRNYDYPEVQVPVTPEPEPEPQVPVTPEPEPENEATGTVIEVPADNSRLLVVDGVEVNMHRDENEPIYFQNGQTVLTEGIVIGPEPEKEGLVYDGYHDYWDNASNSHLEAYEPTEGYVNPLGTNTGSNYSISSDYGTKTHPVTGVETTHHGVDVAARYGSNVYASAAGTVEQAGWSDVYGNHVILRHADGSTSMYAHLSAYHVSAGDTVQQMQNIGNVGDTGEATGSHLHFELRNSQNYSVDPTYLFAE